MTARAQLAHPSSNDQAQRPAPAVDLGPTMSTTEAIRKATEQAMAEDPSVIVMGEGACDPKAIFGTTAGLLDRFGPERVLEMPISENGWTGIAIGAALTGLRPILIHQRVEFALLSMEQLVNNAAKSHYLSEGRHRVPIVVRMIVGRGWGQGPMHSQSLESTFAQFPGLEVLMPSGPADAFAMLKAAVRSDHPVVLIEHRWVHHVQGALPTASTGDDGRSPACQRRGSDATVVSSSYMTLEAHQAAYELAKLGLEVELFDLRSIRPLKLEAIIDSVRKTGRLVTIDTGHRDYGVGAEICAQVSEAAFSSLKAAPLRLGLPAHPTPSSAGLVGNYYPRSTTIARAIAQLCGLPEAAIAGCTQALQRQREDLPIDVPHPRFRGPF